MHALHVISAISQIGRSIGRLIRNGLIVRAFSVLPSNKRNEAELRKLLAG